MEQEEEKSHKKTEWIVAEHGEDHATINAESGDIKSSDDQELVYLGMWGKELKSVSVKEGNFCLKLPKGWKADPVNVEVASRWDQGFFFAGPIDQEWAYVQHLVLSPEHVNDDIKDAINIELRLFGLVSIHPPKGTERLTIKDMASFGCVPVTSSAFLKRHCADRMATWIGTFLRDGVKCRLYILCLQRGREVWRVEYVFPVKEYSATQINWNGKEAVKSDIEYEIGDQPSQPEQIRAGIVLGNFRAYDAARCQLCGKIVSDEDIVEIPLENVDLTQIIGVPIRGECTVKPHCCPECRGKFKAKDISEAQIKAIPAIAEVLQGGARIEDEWLKANVDKSSKRRFWIFIISIAGLFVALMIAGRIFKALIHGAS